MYGQKHFLGNSAIQRFPQRDFGTRERLEKIARHRFQLGRGFDMQNRKPSGICPVYDRLAAYVVILSQRNTVQFVYQHAETIEVVLQIYFVHFFGE